MQFAFLYIIPFVVAFLVSTSSVRAQGLLETVKTGNIESVQRVLSRKSKSLNINETDAEGLTALMVATIANDSVMTEVLLNAGADPNIATPLGVTVLHLAAFHNRDGFCPLILAAGAQPNVLDYRGQTPLHVACQVGSTNVVSQLVGAGAFVNLADRKGNPPIIIACGNRHLGALEELLEKGAYVDARDIRGRTAAMLLSVLGEDEMLRILLRRKPDLGIVDYSGKSALTYARMNRRWTILQILQAAGAKY
ncbi:MAG: ankyrin repeat domain-containing protein [Ignavibacteria bacterium]|nr:ankyrin repeat domain-containing protein [Ignavibacteria bacterium]